MRRRTGKRARAMLDVSRWCRTPGCTLGVAHRGTCCVEPMPRMSKQPVWNVEYVDLNESTPRTKQHTTERAATADDAERAAAARLTVAGDRPSGMKAWR